MVLSRTWSARQSEELEVRVRFSGEPPLKDKIMEYVENLINIYNDSEDEDERAELVAELNEIYKTTRAFINNE